MDITDSPSLTVIERITLGYTAGNSDKTYRLTLVRYGPGSGSGGLYGVVTDYGRRGAAQKRGSGTKTPTSLVQAQQMFTKLLKQKQAKGYAIEGRAVIDTQDAPAETVAAIAPAPTPAPWFDAQLLTAAGEAEVRAMVAAHPGRYYVQIKRDGERRGVKIDGEGVAGANRRGMTCPVSEALASDARLIGVTMRDGGTMILDGEDCGSAGGYYAFDMLDRNGDLRALPFRERAERLKRLAEVVRIKAIGGVTVDVPVRLDRPEQFDSFVRQTRLTNQEGIVVKDGEATYEAGRQGKGGLALKVKYVESATVIVIAQSDHRRSVEVAVKDDTGETVGVGRCTIPVNHAVPEVGDVVEVGYLWAMPRSRALYQPVYKGLRRDVGAEAATLDQIKFKTEAVAA